MDVGGAGFVRMLSIETYDAEAKLVAIITQAHQVSSLGRPAIDRILDKHSAIC